MFAAVSETRSIVQDPVQGPLWITDDRCDGFSARMRTDGERTRMDIKGINDGDGVHHLRAPQGAQPTSSSGEFARVFDLAEARRERMTRADRIPEEVWDDIARAGELADDLAARGQQVRFDTHRLTGRVVASLCDSEGRVLRPVSLRDLLGTEPDPAPAA
jgi:hypothetical protein